MCRRQPGLTGQPPTPTSSQTGLRERGSLDGLIHTFSSSGSHESRVKDRTLEQWTPRLLDREEAGVRQGVAPPPPPPVPRPPAGPPVDA